MNTAHLQGADLRRTTLSGARFGSAHLAGADLSGAFLFAAGFVDYAEQGLLLPSANLQNVSFRDASLTSVNFGASAMSGADFTDTRISEVVFLQCDLSQVIGLDCVRNDGPSTITLETIYLSKGKIPESFLRGCGVPESFITQMHSLVGAEGGIQFYSCFISYSGKDEDFAKRLHGKMRDAHLRVWFAPEDVQGGKKLHEQIETAIRLFDKLVIVLSEASLQSEWVMDELRKGFKAEQDAGKRKLFPVRLIDYATLKRWECRDSTSGKDLAEEVRQYFIPDFSNWKDHDQFETAFARLLKDLRAEERAK